SAARPKLTVTPVSPDPPPGPPRPLSSAILAADVTVTEDVRLHPRASDEQMPLLHRPAEGVPGLEHSLVIGALRALFGVDALHDCESGAHHVDGELAQERAAGDQRGQRVAVPRVVLGDDSLVGLP